MTLARSSFKNIEDDDLDHMLKECYIQGLASVRLQEDTKLQVSIMLEEPDKLFKLKDLIVYARKRNASYLSNGYSTNYDSSSDFSDSSDSSDLHTTST